MARAFWASRSLGRRRWRLERRAVARPALDAARAKTAAHAATAVGRRLSDRRRPRRRRVQNRRRFLGQKYAARSIADQRRTPGETAAKRRENKQLPAFDAPVADPLVERQRYRRRRSVGVPVDGDDDLVFGKFEALGAGFDDPDIRLMRHEPVDLLAFPLRALRHFKYGVGNFLNGVAEYFLAVHPHLADRRGRGGAAVGEKMFGEPSVCGEIGCKDAARRGGRVRLVGREDDRAGAVAEEDAGSAIA